MNKKHFILLSILFLIFNSYYAGISDLLRGNSQDKIVPVEQAFQFTVSNNIEDDNLEIYIKVAPNTYLYKKKFKFNIDNNNINLLNPIYPEGQIKQDEVFGEVVVFESDFKITIPYNMKNNISDNLIMLDINYQGCMSKKYCYPPQEKSFEITFNNAENNIKKINTKHEQTENIAYNLLEKASFWNVIFSFFIFGIFLSFTPCVLPMIPILSSVITGKNKFNNQHVIHHNAFLLSITYVISMSLVYAIAGILVATAGYNLQAYLQNPIVIIVITILFILLALSMFGLYEVTIPHFIEDKIGALYRKQKGGSYLGASIMGIIATLIVSPCTTAPLAGALLYIATTGNSLLGALALFFLSLGMGIPLIIIGLSSQKLLPKAGKWMDSFKFFFGIILMGMAIYILSRIIPDYITLALWGVLLIFYAVILGVLEPAPEFKSRLIKSIAFIMIIFGIIYLVGAVNYNVSPFEPLKNYSFNQDYSNNIKKPDGRVLSNLNWVNIGSLKDLNIALDNFHQNKNYDYALLDFTAKWCASCFHIEREVFENPKIISELNKIYLIKSDITDYNDKDKQLMQNFKVFNPPTILFFDKDKKEIQNMRITGEITFSEFNMHLNKMLN